MNAIYKLFCKHVSLPENCFSITAYHSRFGQQKALRQHCPHFKIMIYLLPDSTNACIPIFVDATA
jgi:hypothetical protein